MMSILLVVSDESKDMMLNGAWMEGLILVVELIGRHSTREPIGHDKGSPRRHVDRKSVV